MEIRPALLEDALDIASLLLAAFVEYRSVYTEAGFAATTLTTNQVELRIFEGSIWVAVENGKIVGTVSAMPKGNSLYICSMAVLPAARGQKVASELLKRIESIARSKDYERMFLSTTPFLNSAIRLYKRFGFQKTSEGPHDLHGTPLFTMEKVLDP